MIQYQIYAIYNIIFFVELVEYSSKKYFFVIIRIIFLGLVRSNLNDDLSNKQTARTSAMQKEVSGLPCDRVPSHCIEDPIVTCFCLRPTAKLSAEGLESTFCITLPVSGFLELQKLRVQTF
jgi:hypothetical protein